MNHRFLALLAVLAFTPAAYAQTAAAPATQDAHHTKAEELIRITHVDQITNQLTGQITARMKASAEQQNARHAFTPEQQKLVNDYIDQVQTLTQSAVTFDKLKPSIVQAYADTYTDPELDGIIAFYRSAAGQAMIAKSPQLSNKTIQIVQNQMTTIQPQLQQVNEDFGRKMRELSSPPPASGTPAPAPAPAPAH
ncbi:MAG TPA: DUF2059 domain-containing protein [Edaphobacter sp.]